MFDFFRQRPILSTIGGVGVALILLWALMGRAGGGSDTSNYAATPQTGPSPDAALQASTSVQMAQLSAATSIRLAENERLIRAQETSLAAELTKLGYQLEDRNGERAYNLGRAQIDSQERVTTVGYQASTDAAMIAGAVSMNEVNALRDVEISRISQESSAYIQAAQIQAQGAVNAAKASKSKGFSFGPFSIRF